MVNLAHSRTPAFKSVQTTTLAELPDGALPLTSIRRIEENFWQKQLLTKPTVHLPFWFCAEMERNIGLWRLGISLEDAPRFDLWIDVPAVFERRINRLELSDSSAPATVVAAELSYLHQLADLLSEPVLLHAHALSVSIAHTAPRNLPVVLIPSTPLIRPSP